MKPRPSTRILAPVVDRTPVTRSAQSLLRRLVVVGGVATVILVGGIGTAGLYSLRRSMLHDADDRISHAATLSRHLVDRVLAERSRQVELIAKAPQVIASAKKGATEALRLGLPAQLGSDMPSATLDGIEARFKATRSLQVDEPTNQYLKTLLPTLDIAEVMLTDRYGYNAVTTSPSSDFVQSDETWWQNAWTTGTSKATATADPATQRTVVELAGAVEDAGSRVGVVKVKFGLSAVDSVLAQGAGDQALRVDLVDSSGKVIASSIPSTRFKIFSGIASLTGREGGEVLTFAADSGDQRGAVVTANHGRWRVIAHSSNADALHTYRVARWVFVGGLATMLMMILGALTLVVRFVERRVTRPARDLATAAEAVAGGDLSMVVEHTDGNDEIARLARSVGAMIEELRRLALALNESVAETGTMTGEITAGTEEMAAAAGQIAHTASDLSQQSSVMAQTIHGLVASSGQLVEAASALDEGAHVGVERNARLRNLALENRARLDESSRSLALLTSGVESNATAIDQLAQASEEVRTFVTLVQKLARQSKLLALNAAMEAARAGEHGHGFAVVAEEVRRLWAMSSEAAVRTERVVGTVLNGIAQSRASSERTVETVRAVRGATEEGSRSFGQIEEAVAEADAWTTSIESTVGAAAALTRDMSAKLDSLSFGTESFAAAMEEVAASSQEQSASTEQIAAAAATLSEAAERLTRLVANLRIDGVSITQAMPVPSSLPVARGAAPSATFAPAVPAPAPAPPRVNKPIPLGSRLTPIKGGKRVPSSRRSA